jgi:hypothetical protein
MRTSTDLILELERERSHFKTVALAVGFENHTEYVFGHETNRAKKLANLMHKGGEPIGLMGIRIWGNTATVHTRLLEEYEGETWAKEYLESLASTFKEIAEKLGAA